MPTLAENQIGRNRSHGPRWYVLLSVFFLLVGEVALPAAPETLSEQKIQQIMKSVAELRGLTFKKEIPVQNMSRKKLSGYIRRKLEEDLPPEEAKKFEQSLQAFGLFPRNKTLMKSLEKLLVRSVAGFYEPDTDKLFLIREMDASDDQPGFNPFGKGLDQLGIKPQELHASHELTHALQDQHFDLAALPFRDDENDDRVMAQKALIEGEATYVMYEYLLQKQGMSFDGVMSSFTPMLEQLLFSEVPAFAGADAPLFVQKMLIFPYMAGIRFVREGMNPKNGDTWSKLNRAYRDMPSSTEQILHPELYFDSRDAPEWPDLPEVKRFKQGGYSFLQENRFGEYGIHLLFLEHLDGKQEQIRDARTGWDGDVYRTYGTDSGNRFRYIWMSTWDSETDAREFAALYGKVLDRKLDGAESMTRSGRQLFVDEEGRLSFVHRMGTDVLIGEHLPRENAASTIRRVWHQTSWTSPDKSGK